MNNKQAREGSPGLEALDPNSILFLERCRVHDASGPGVACQPGGSAAVVGCEISGSGGPGILVNGGGRAVLNDSYVYWNGGAGVQVDAGAVMSLEHNDCSLNKGGPMRSEGVVRVSRGEGGTDGGMGVCFFVSRRVDVVPIPLPPDFFFSSFFAALRERAAAGVVLSALFCSFFCGRRLLAEGGCFGIGAEIDSPEELDCVAARRGCACMPA